ncbi:hypothetical protein [Ornithinimicrobium kibberense]|uniref:hypothetical protein n=1 Tax=Ornithinimicrobium kibberense TaxID=282060 RepID=UPI00361B4997
MGQDVTGRRGRATRSASRPPVEGSAKCSGPMRRTVVSVTDCSRRVRRGRCVRDRRGRVVRAGRWSARC